MSPATRLISAALLAATITAGAQVHAQTPPPPPLPPEQGSNGPPDTFVETRRLAQENGARALQELLWRQQQTTRNFYITESVPTECRNAVYNAPITWNSSHVNVNSVWSGYVNNYAYAYDSSTAKNFSTSSNTLDTWFQVGVPDQTDALAETEWRYPSGGYNAAANPQWTAVDADIIINNNRYTEFYCYTSTAVGSTQHDMQSVMTHEFGHHWGLGHDCGSTNTTAVMFEFNYPGSTGMKRTLYARDVARGQYIYGSK